MNNSLSANNHTFESRMSIPHVHAEKLDADRVIFQIMGKNIGIGYKYPNGEVEPLRVIFPEMRAPFGASWFNKNKGQELTTETKVDVRFSFDRNSERLTKIQATLEKIDNKLIEFISTQDRIMAAIKVSKVLSNGKEKPREYVLDEICGKYKSIVLQNKNPDYDATIKGKIGRNALKQIALPAMLNNKRFIINEDNLEDSLSAKIRAKFIIEYRNVWFAQQMFGINPMLRAVNIKKVMQYTIPESFFAISNDDEPDNTTTTTNSDASVETV